MLEYTVSTPKPLLDYLAGYLSKPLWDHAIDIVPLVAAAPDPAWPLWTEETLADPGLRAHLIRSLARWSAFRGKGKHRAKQERLLELLSGFIADIQAIPNSRLCLADAPAEHVEQFSSDLVVRLGRLGCEVKGQASCVLPSKTCHLLLPTLIPAYDQEQIAKYTLPAVVRDAWSMGSYLTISWWILQEFRRQGTLSQAHRDVAGFLLGDWTRRVLAPGKPRADHTILNSLDSVLAEYTLIQKGREAKTPLLRWQTVAKA